MEKKLYHCAAYYPELWDESFIDSDIAYMKKAGINCVRMAEFAWHKMEPLEGEIDVSFFVRVADKLWANGISVMMCTPTPTPPIWLTHDHPERLSVNYQGRTYIHGGRQHVCTNNPYFRKRAAIITEALAKAFQGHPAVIGWQLDNEFKAQTSECMCASCREQWHDWLRDKYVTADALNKAWGTEIWSQYYNDISQVVQPIDTTYCHNSSLHTEYRRFTREKLNEFAHEQAEILHRYGAAVTTDVHTSFPLFAEELFSKLDFTSTNIYTTDKGFTEWLFSFDMYRNLKGDNRFFVTETSPNFNGNLNGQGHYHHRKGFVPIEALSTYAAGGFGFSYWLFKQQRSGCEQPHGALLSPWNKPTTGFFEAETVEKIRKTVEPYFLETSPAPSRVAITYSEQARMYFFTEKLLDGADYLARMWWLHARFENAGVPRELLPEGGSLENTGVLFSPLMPYVSKEYKERALRFAENGGIWVIGPMTGWRTEFHTANTDCALSDLEKLAGVEVEQFYPVSVTGAVGEAFGKAAPLCMQITALKAVDSKVVGTVSGGITPGTAFITEKNVGKGKIVMIAAMPVIGSPEGDALTEAIIKHYSLEAGCHPFEATPGTTVLKREGKYTVYIAMNGDGFGGEYTLPKDGHELFSDADIKAGRRTLPPFGYEVVVC